MGCGASAIEDDIELQVAQAPPKPNAPASRSCDIFDASSHKKTDIYARKMMQFEKGHGKTYKIMSLQRFTKELVKKSNTDIGKVRAIFVFLCFLDVDTLDAPPAPPAPPRDDAAAPPTEFEPNSNNSNNAVQPRAESTVNNQTTVQSRSSNAPAANSTSRTAGQAEREDDHKTMLELLHDLKDSRINHAHLFANMCKAAGMSCEVIDGINKNSLYDPEHPPKTRDEVLGLRAQWNAVKMYNEYRFVDVHWASSCTLGGQPTRLLNEHYFLTDPDRMIGTHMPFSSQWQLLPHAIKLKYFFKMPKLGDRFFKMDLKASELSPKRFLLNSKDGLLELGFSIASRKKIESDDKPFSKVQHVKHMHFKAIFTLVDDNNESFDQYILYQKSLDEVRYRFRFNGNGKFYIKLYGANETLQHYGLLCSYIAECNKPHAPPDPYPDNPRIGWGTQTVESHVVGVRPVSHPHIDITLQEGDVTVILEVDEGVEVVVELKHLQRDETALSKYVLFYPMGKRQVAVELRLPLAGEYALGIFAANLKKNRKAKMTNVMNYLVTCTEKSSHTPYPLFSNGSIGAGVYSKALGLHLESHERPTLATTNSKFEIRFRSTSGWQYCELTHHCIGADKLQDAVSLVRTTEGCKLACQLPEFGEYAINIYGSENKDAPRLYHMFTYYVKYKPSQQKGGKPKKLIKTEYAFTEDKMVDVCLPNNVPIGHLKAEYKRKYISEPSMRHGAIKLGNISGSQVICTCMLEYGGEYAMEVFRINEVNSLKRIQRHSIFRYTGQGDEDGKGAKIEEEIRKEIKTKFHKSKLREAMSNRKATHREKVVLLKRVISNYEKEDIPKVNEYHQARRLLTICEIERDIEETMRNRDIEGLSATIERIHDNHLVSRLANRLQKAERRLVHFKRMQRFEKMIGTTERILELSGEMIAEVKTFNHPPETIERILTATLVLLGDDPDKVDMPNEATAENQRWRRVLAVMYDHSKGTLEGRIFRRKSEDIDIEDAFKARDILCDLDVAKVRKTSDNAIHFYFWCMCMIEDAEEKDAAQFRQQKIQEQQLHAAATEFADDSESGGDGSDEEDGDDDDGYNQTTSYGGSRRGSIASTSTSFPLRRGSTFLQQQQQLAAAGRRRRRSTLLIQEDEAQELLAMTNRMESLRAKFKHVITATQAFRDGIKEEEEEQENAEDPNNGDETEDEEDAQAGWEQD